MRYLYFDWILHECKHFKLFSPNAIKLHAAFQFITEDGIDPYLNHTQCSLLYIFFNTLHIFHHSRYWVSLSVINYELKRTSWHTSRSFVVVIFFLNLKTDCTANLHFNGSNCSVAPASASEWKLSWNSGWLPPNDTLRQTSSQIDKNSSLDLFIKPWGCTLYIIIHWI